MRPYLSSCLDPNSTRTIFASQILEPLSGFSKARLAALWSIHAEQADTGVIDYRVCGKAAGQGRSGV